MTDQIKGLLITLAGVLLVVPDALFVRLITAEPLTIAFWRLFLAGGVSGLGILLWRGTTPFRAVLNTGACGVIYMVGIGGSGVLFVLAVSLTSVANVVFIIAALPVFAALFSRVFLAEPIRPAMVMTILSVAAGLGIIAAGSGENENAALSGDLLALCVAALFAAGLTAARRVRHVSMVPGAAMGYVVAAMLILPFTAPLSVPAGQVPLVLAHGIFILGSSVLLAIGPRFISSPEVGLLVLLESVLAPLLVWAVVNEHPGQWTLVGGAVVVGALSVSNFRMLMRRQIRSRQ
ncbi:DMT family transporter [uncultured Roseobacter sp.]|uniref:DMT family transporter n=1 Tax=uncultured Roseobacter sp. TaxID=114847 RepID=UPI00261FF5A2|nr:DMT family transporter [uncultured Roseobacter sp.]